jgi:intracellular multiplication protein IcmG
MAIPILPSVKTNQVDTTKQPSVDSKGDIESISPFSKTATPLPVTTQIEGKLTQLQKQTETLQTTINNQKAMFQGQLSTLENNMSHLRSDIEDLKTNINLLTQQVKKTAELVAVTSKRQEIIGHQQVKKIQQLKRYFVSAVIPGRAWIQGADGTAQTVAVGDLIPGYGRVTSINAYSGTVTTSSGVKIYYGINE